MVRGNTKAKAFRTIDLSRAEGLKETVVDGISFDWENVKSNYMPFHGEPTESSWHPPLERR